MGVFGDIDIEFIEQNLEDFNLKDFVNVQLQLEECVLQFN